MSRFGVAAEAKLSNPLVSGEPEDQLRAPLEGLLADLAALAGFSEGAVTAIGEHSLSDLKTRPDYAVTVDGALVGHIEVKAPGKGADRVVTQGEAEAGTRREGVICYITAAGFLAGDGFQKIRADLRRDCSDVWVIDCSPEGQFPDTNTRIFQGVPQPVCIVLAARAPDIDETAPARVRYTALPEGHREAKFDALTALHLDGEAWDDASDSWRASFLPAASGDWASYPKLFDLFIPKSDGTGVMTGRTWPIAPDAETLRQRWQRLTADPDPKK